MVGCLALMAGLGPGRGAAADPVPTLSAQRVDGTLVITASATDAEGPGLALFVVMVDGVAVLSETWSSTTAHVAMAMGATVPVSAAPHVVSMRAANRDGQVSTLRVTR